MLPEQAQDALFLLRARLLGLRVSRELSLGDTFIIIISESIYIYICVYIYVYIVFCVCVYVCVYIYIYTHVSAFTASLVALYLPNQLPDYPEFGVLPGSWVLL